jgi:hypothetical protein
LPRGDDQHVLARDAATGTCPDDRIEIDVVLFCQAAHGRRGTAPSAVIFSNR